MGPTSKGRGGRGREKRRGRGEEGRGRERGQGKEGAGREGEGRGTCVMALGGMDAPDC